MLYPEEVKIIKSSPAIRRNYLNIELSQLNKQYLRSLNNYNSLIKNKNEYLKKMQFLNISDTTYLDTLDEKIVDEGMVIYKCRSDYIEMINKYIDEKFKKFIKGIFDTPIPTTATFLPLINVLNSLKSFFILYHPPIFPFHLIKSFILYH